MITRGKTGFTLIEMLVVIAIIGILAGLLLPVLNKVKLHGKRTKAREMIYQIASAFSLYFDDYRELPDAVVTNSDTNTMKILSGASFNDKGYAYMEFTTNEWQNGVVDPWGNQYRIMLDNGKGGDNTAYDNYVNVPHNSPAGILKTVAVWSKGQNGKDSTAAERADDIVSWY